MSVSVGDYVDCLNWCRKTQPDSKWFHSRTWDLACAGVEKSSRDLADMHWFLCVPGCKCDVTSCLKSLSSCFFAAVNCHLGLPAEMNSLPS